jgi:hypothetical protein
VFYDRLQAMLIVLESTTLCGALATPRLFETTQTNRSGSVVEILWISATQTDARSPE